jgi:hypothetical protein
VIERYTGSVLPLLPIAQDWVNGVRENSFGLEVTVTRFMDDLQRLVDNDNSDLFVLVKDVPVGLLGMTIFTSPIGNNRIANEHYWYVLPEHRSVESIRMLSVAKKWAKDNGCSHLMMNASNLASDLHDRVSGVYERMGMKKMETVYMQRI